MNPSRSCAENNAFVWILFKAPALPDGGTWLGTTFTVEFEAELDAGLSGGGMSTIRLVGLPIVVAVPYMSPLGLRSKPIFKRMG